MRYPSRLIEGPALGNKLFSIEDRGQADRVTPQRALDPTATAGFGCATLHASPS